VRSGASPLLSEEKRELSKKSRKGDRKNPDESENSKSGKGVRQSEEWREVSREEVRGQKGGRKSPAIEMLRQNSQTKGQRRGGQKEKQRKVGKGRSEQERKWVGQRGGVREKKVPQFKMGRKKRERQSKLRPKEKVPSRRGRIPKCIVVN